MTPARAIIRHTGIYGIVMHNNTILAIRKARGPYTGMYDLPGGKPEVGESAEEALTREFIEETGCRVVHSSLLTVETALADWEYDGVPSTTHHIGIYYLVSLAEGATPLQEGDGHDSLGCRWIELTEGHIATFAPIAQQAIKRALQSTPKN